MNFILIEMTFLRYFLPLAIEGNKKNVKSTFFIGKTSKYNSPHLHKKELELVCKVHNIEIKDISEIQDDGKPIILVEGVYAKNLSGLKGKKYSLTYMSDYSVGNYENYLGLVDHVVFPSFSLASNYNTMSEKNLYLGSPKYDISLKKEEILKKYNLSDSKKALVIAPKLRDIANIQLNGIYDVIRSAGYQVLVKTRGKDPMNRSLHGDRYFEDASWFPHTSMELIEISDFVINFDSTSIKECVLLRTPVINFNIKPFKQPFYFLYNEKYCIDIKEKIDYNKLKKHIEKIVTVKEEDFDNVIKEHLFDYNSSQKILEHMFKND